MCQLFVQCKNSQTWSNDKLNYLKWKNFEYQVVRYHQDLNILYRQFFQVVRYQVVRYHQTWSNDPFDDLKWKKNWIQSW